MLDVICGGMGAFLILVIILMPYYKKEVIDLTASVAELEAQVQAERQAREAAERRAQAAQAKLQETPLMVIIEWEAPIVDVDLHVIDPTGAEFYFERKMVPGRPGWLSEDDIEGPGFEIWEVEVAPAGRYKILYNLFSRRGSSQDPSVKGRVFSNRGIERLPIKTLSVEKRKELVAILEVGEDGSVRVSPQ
jgi:hypothetical protein